MSDESPKAPAAERNTVIACGWPAKNVVLDLQKAYRMLYGDNISQEKITDLMVTRAALTVEDLPAPEVIRPVQGVQ